MSGAVDHLPAWEARPLGPDGLRGLMAAVDGVAAVVRVGMTKSYAEAVAAARDAGASREQVVDAVRWGAGPGREEEALEAVAVAVTRRAEEESRAQFPDYVIDNPKEKNP